MNVNKFCDKALINGFAPEPLLTVSSWADKYRVLSQKASAEPGRWHTARTPYLKEIMDTLSPSCQTQEIVFMKGGQLGGTEAGCNWLGFIIDYAPGPCLLVQPTVEMAKRNSRQRIDSMIDESARLSEKVKPARARDSGNTVLSKEFPGGLLVMTGANSATGLRSLSARYIFFDECDAYNGDADGEGDPVSLAKARSRNFARKKIFYVSTPTITGRSRVEFLYEASDKRKYFVPCPHCQGMQTLKWKQIKFEKNAENKIVGPVVYTCELCGLDIQEHEKGKMLASGEWRKEKPESHIAGFHLSSLYSPVGWYSWADAARDWLDAQKDQDKLRAFINTVLGETWKDKGDAPEWDFLFNRREQYKIGEVPKEGLFLTCGADVQKDRIEAEVVAFGKDKQSWSINYFIFMGDTATQVPWLEMNKLMSMQFPREGGGSMPINIMAVDTGYNTQHVYNWCRGFPANKVLPIKGQANLQVIMGPPKAVDINIQGKRITRGVQIWAVGVDLLKSELYSWLKLKRLEDGTWPNGFCHFPEYSEEYFKQLTAEQLHVRLSKGYRRYEWEKTRERNEALDARIYARAAASFFGLDRFSENQWHELERNFKTDEPENKNISGPQIIRKKSQSGFWQ